MDKKREDPAVSVIVPVYNTASYVSVAVKSVMDQSFKDWELILVDDGSVDESGAICDAFASKNERISVIHTPNGGLSKARNTGLSHARGNYLQFLDSDDWLFPDALEKAITTAEKEDADMVIFDALYEWPDRAWHEASPIAGGAYTSDYILEQLSILRIPPYAWNKFCKRCLYDGVLFPENEAWEDVATTFYPVAGAGKIVVLNEALYHYRQRDEAISKKAAKDGTIYYWRYHQYSKRYEAIKENHPKAAALAKSSVVRNGIYYTAFCLKGRNHRTERNAVRKYLSKAEFSRDLSLRASLIRIAFLAFPSIISVLIRWKKGAE